MSDDDTPPGPPRWALPPDPGPEAPSGLHPVLKSEMRAELKTERWFAWLRNLITAAAATAAGLFAGVNYLDNRVMAQTDAGTRLVNIKADSTQHELERHEAEESAIHVRQEASQARLEMKLDVMLERFQIHNPAPAPKDGGR